jgi:hypothetical protein
MSCAVRSCCIVTEAAVFTFSSEEYVGVHCTKFCTENASAAEEYQQWRISNQWVFLNVHEVLQENSTLPIVSFDRWTYSGLWPRGGNIPQVSTQRICPHLSVLCMRVWRTLNTEGQYPYHIHQIQHLQSADVGRQLEFYHTLTAHLHLHHWILFVGESHLIHSEGSNTRPPQTYGLKTAHTEQYKAFVTSKFIFR